MKTKTIPFDLEMAEKIQTGEIEGKIVCRSSLNNDYKPARIICWDRIPSYPIVALVEIGPYYEVVYFFDKTGKTSDGHHLCIKLPEGVKKVRISDAIERIANNFKTKQEGEAFKQGIIFAVGISAEYRDQLGIYGKEQTLFSEKDIKEMLLKQAEEDYEKALCIAKKEKLKHEFKPFDKVLVRGNDASLWKAGFYSHELDGKHCVCGDYYLLCIPYEGNQELVGTCNEPKCK